MASKKQKSSTDYGRFELWLQARSLKLLSVSTIYRLSILRLMNMRSLIEIELFFKENSHRLWSTDYDLEIIVGRS